jgi:hypothetical protein
MKIKSAYRNNSQAQFPAEKIPPSEKIDINGEPAADAVRVHHESDAPPNMAVAEAMAKASTADEATLRFQHQLASLRQSEEIQRQAAAMPQRPMTREEKLAAWRAQGMSAEDERTLTERPEMIDYHGLTAIAAHEAARQGHERGTEGHRQATKVAFDRHLAKLQAQAASNSPATRTPEFFRPPPPPEPPSPASYVSAPVSRGDIGGPREPTSPSQVKLSPEEVEIARASGITPTEYARHKISMMRKQRAGEIQR